MEGIATVVVFVIFVVAAMATLIAFSQKHAKEYRERREREVRVGFMNPDPSELARKLGHPLPAALLRMHANRGIGEEREFEVIPPPEFGADGGRWSVLWFLPLTPASIDEHDMTELAGCMPIAEDFDHNAYYIDVASGADDPAVRIFFYETGQHLLVADSLSDFLSWPRRPVASTAK